MRVAIAALLVLMGAGIAGIWSRDIVTGTNIEKGQGIFSARDPNSGSLFWPHWLAEYATATILVVAGVGLLYSAAWSTTLAALAVGALLYTSTNSLGWSLAQADRRAYAAPMIFGVIVALLAAVYLLTI